MKNCCTVQNNHTKTPNRIPGETGKDRRKLSGSGTLEDKKAMLRAQEPKHKIRLVSALGRITQQLNSNDGDTKKEEGDRAPRSAWAAAHAGTAQQCSER